MNLLFFLTIFIFLNVLPSYADSKSAGALEANHLYEEKNYEEALKRYVGLNLEFPDDPKIQYNLANTYYQLKKYEEAGKSFLSSAMKAGDPSLKQNSWFNLGNSLFGQGKLEEAVTAYQKSLDLNPDDVEAKQNLEFVREEIKKRINEEKERKEKEKQKESEKEKNKDKEKDQQEGEKQENQEKQKDQQKQEDQEEQKKGEEKKEGQDQKQESGKEKKEEQKNQGEAQPEKPEEKEGEASEAKQASPEEDKGEKEKAEAAQQSMAQQGEKKEMSEEEAQRWLNSLKEDGSKFLKKQIKGKPGKGSRGGQDW